MRQASYRSYLHGKFSCFTITRRWQPLYCSNPTAAILAPVGEFRLSIIASHQNAQPSAPNRMCFSCVRFITARCYTKRGYEIACRLSAATEFRCGGRFYFIVFRIYLRIQKWKNYWNRSTFAKVIVKITVARFFMAHCVDRSLQRRFLIDSIFFQSGNICHKVVKANVGQWSSWWNTGWAKKSKPDNFCNNFVYCQPIFVIFGTYTL